MAVAVDKTKIPTNILDEITSELILHAKGAKNKSYTPKVSQMTAFESYENKLVIPLIYARRKFGLKGFKNANDIEFVSPPKKFFEGQKEVFDEAINLLMKEGSVFLQLNCGWGKTWLALNLTASLRKRTMFLVHRGFLKDQFIKEAETIIPGQLKVIDDNEVDANTEGSSFICTDKRALKLPEEFIKTIDFVVVDEAKYWCTPTRLEALLRFRPVYTMGLCAERERRDGFHTLLDMFFGTNIYRKSNKPFVVWKYMTDFKPIAEPLKFGYGINWSKAMISLSEMEERNIIIRDICRLRQKDKIMILVQYKKHVEVLEQMLKEVGESVDTFYGKKKNYKTCRILIATFSKAEMGFDDKNLCDGFDGKRLNLLILGSFYKREIEQSIGRVRRTDGPEIIDVVDNYSTLKKHSKTRDKWYRAEYGTVMKPEYIFSMKSN